MSPQSNATFTTAIHNNRKAATMVAGPRSKSSRKIGGETLHRLTKATVERVWTQLVATHDVCGMIGPEGRNIAAAWPRDGFRPGARCWLGYSMDGGKTWYGCHLPMGRRAQQLLAALGQEVKL